MPKQKIRFGVGSAQGPRSAIWSLFWREHDAYLVSVEAGGVAKFSFHLKIDEFSWGYTRDYFQANRLAVSHRESRDFERWKRPPEFEPGLTLPLRIYVANEALKPDDMPTAKSVRWVLPEDGKAVGFLFVLAHFVVGDDPYKETPGLTRPLPLGAERRPAYPERPNHVPKDNGRGMVR